MSSSTQLVLPSIAVPPATDLTDLWNGTNYALQQMTRQMQVMAGGFNVTKTTVDPTGGSSGGAGLSIYPLDANSVGTTQLVDTSIISSKIAANAVLTANILDSAITTLKIANSAVTSAQVAVNTITGGLTGNLASATITAYNIVAQTITASQIAAATILGSNIAAATITGGNIAALTITASNIAANTITASQIAAGTITTTQIAAGTIIGNNIAASTITAGLLSVSQLSAISSNMGTITAGTITVSSTGFIKGGQTAYNIGTGWWLGYDSTAYKFSIGDGTKGMQWDGTALNVTAASGSRLTVITPTQWQIGNPAYKNFQLQFSGLDPSFVLTLADGTTPGAYIGSGSTYGVLAATDGTNTGTVRNNQIYLAATGSTSFSQLYQWGISAYAGSHTVKMDATSGWVIDSTTIIDTSGNASFPGTLKFSNCQLTKQRPLSDVPTLAGGVVEESFNVDISGYGFTSKATSGLCNCSSDKNYHVRYDYDDGRNSSTNAVIKVSRYDGTNTSAGAIRISCAFFQ